jgi:hypothetical protein
VKVVWRGQGFESAGRWRFMEVSEDASGHNVLPNSFNMGL